MKKILTVFGTRREAIKTAPVVLALQKTEGIESIESDSIDSLINMMVFR